MPRRKLLNQKKQLEALIIANMMIANWASPFQNLPPQLYRSGRAIMAEYEQIMNQLR
ncbi:hypothetical protein [Spirosoma endbachense]|uniref:Uncharacterized protein n=1 Tax=Spirosoma endbachense TaxID=2666025 RepID=A0A6P1W5Q7_9BACT|nr:hypothetical protein [Spirosoma endbachense]QHV99270.1 hypothetical protein GJR95_31535 [Spirosoma endbachense]